MSDDNVITLHQQLPTTIKCPECGSSFWQIEQHQWDEEVGHEISFICADYTCLTIFDGLYVSAVPYLEADE